MWKEKLYTGTVSTSATTTTVKKYPDVNYTITSVNIAKTDILNDCIRNFLIECGVSSSDIVYYPCSGSDERKGNLFIYGTPFQFYVSSSNVYYQVYSGNTFQPISGSSSYTVCFDSSGNYKIRISFVGNPNSAFGFIVGSYGYGSTTYYGNYIMLHRMQNAVDDSYWTLIYNLQSPNSMWLTKCSDSSRPYNSAITTGLKDEGNVSIIQAILTTLNDNKYPLIPKYWNLFKMLDCYVEVSYAALGLTQQSTPAQCYFVMLGTKTYFAPVYNVGILIDCG